MLDKHENQLRYCLYARKSSESDERQAMSIDSQLAEMRSLAENKGLNIVCELQESHSAKESGQTTSSAKEPDQAVSSEAEPEQAASSKEVLSTLCLLEKLRNGNP